MLSNCLFAVELLTSSIIHSCMEERNYHNLKPGFDSFCLSLGQSTIDATRAENLSFQYMFQARLTLNGSGSLSQLVQPNIAQFVDCTTRLFAELDGFFCLPKSSIIDLVRYPVRNNSTNFLNVPHSFFISQDNILCNSFNSELDFTFGLFFLNK